MVPQISLSIWLVPRRFVAAIVYFTSCGSLVNNTESLTKLKARIEGWVESLVVNAYWQWCRFKVKHAVAFDAPHLQTTLTAELLARLMKHVVLYGLDFMKVIEDILPDMSDLGCHSSIIHFVDGKVVQYIWAHRTIQPWGQCYGFSFFPLIFVHLLH